MKLYKTIILLFLVCLSVEICAQGRYGWVIDSLEKNSPGFKALKARNDAEKAEARATTFLDNPEVAFGYYWGSPSDIGKRWDLSVTQSFEMPSVYVHKNRIRKLTTEYSDNDYARQRIELLTEAMEACADMVYYNAYVTLYAHCVKNARRVAELYERKLEAGECGILEYNRVAMDLASIENKLHSAEAERDMMLDNLKMLNGGKQLAFAQDKYERVNLPSDFDQWFEKASSKNPELKLLKQQQTISEEQAKLAKSEWLPKMAVGYASENVVGETFRGVTVQATLPLWHQKGTIKKAQAQERYAQAEYENIYARQYNHLKGLYRKAQTLSHNLQNLQETFTRFNSEELLLKAFEAGEITLENYLQQVEFYHDSEIEILEIAHELEHTVLALEKFEN